MQTEHQRLIEDVEKLREKGYHKSALELFTEMIEMAKRDHNLEVETSALGHRIVCNKLMYRHDPNPVYLKKMEEDCLTGINLPVSDEQRAVFFLRLGDLLELKGRFEEAKRQIETAYKYVKKGGIEEVEYLGHLGIALYHTKLKSTAFTILENAINKASKVSDFREFHMLIVLSKINAWLCRVAFVDHSPIAGLKAFCRGYFQAWKLRIKYKMPERLLEYHNNMFGYFL